MEQTHRSESEVKAQSLKNELVQKEIIAELQEKRLKLTIVWIGFWLLVLASIGNLDRGSIPESEFYYVVISRIVEGLVIAGILCLIGYLMSRKYWRPVRELRSLLGQGSQALRRAPLVEPKTRERRGKSDIW